MGILPKRFRIGLPVQLILLIILALTFGDWISMDLKQFFYATSLTIKEVLIFVLPVIVFSYLTSCMLSFDKGVVAFVAILLTTVFISNFISFMMAYGACSLSLSKMSSGGTLQAEAINELLPMWNFVLPNIISNKTALFSGLCIGVFFSYKPNEWVTKIALYGKNFSDWFLNKVFIPVVPLFILGFVIKLDYEGKLNAIVTTYGPIFLLAVAAEGLYIIFLYGLFFNFNIKEWITSLRNAMPAAVVGFSSMSSAASMPLVLMGAEKNTAHTKRPDLFRVLVPASTNIHMVGNSMTVPLLALSILYTFGIALPSPMAFATFAFFASIAAFAAAGTPGGGLIIMYSVLKFYLGLTDEMISLLTALYLLFEPLTTAINVLGNGIYAVFFTKLFSKLRMNQ